MLPIISSSSDSCMLSFRARPLLLRGFFFILCSSSSSSRTSDGTSSFLGLPRFFAILSGSTDESTSARDFLDSFSASLGFGLTGSDLRGPVLFFFFSAQKTSISSFAFLRGHQRGGNRKHKINTHTPHPSHPPSYYAPLHNSSISRNTPCGPSSRETRVQSVIIRNGEQ